MWLNISRAPREAESNVRPLSRHMSISLKLRRAREEAPEDACLTANSFAPAATRRCLSVHGMRAPDTTADVPHLRLKDDGVSFVCGDVRVDVPSASARRSHLICDLRQQADADACLPLPLSQLELQSWLECANSIGDDGQATASFAADHDDDTLLRASKVCTAWEVIEPSLNIMFCD